MVRLTRCISLVWLVSLLLAGCAGCGRRSPAAGELGRQFVGLWSVRPDHAPPGGAYPTYVRLGNGGDIELLCSGAPGCFGGALGPTTYVRLADGRECSFGLAWDSMTTAWSSSGNDRLRITTPCDPGSYATLEFVFRTDPAGNASPGARVELVAVDGRAAAQSISADDLGRFRWWIFRRCAGSSIDAC